MRGVLRTDGTAQVLDVWLEQISSRDPRDNGCGGTAEDAVMRSSFEALA
jgi:hypothetical protein